MSAILNKITKLGAQLSARFTNVTAAQSTEIVSLSTAPTQYEQIRLLADHCPTMTNLEWKLERNVTAQNFDQIFGKCRKIETLRLDFGDCSFEQWMEKVPLTNFWALQSLRSLEMINCRIGDGLLMKMVDSFKRLECLKLNASDVTARALASLRALKDLRRLMIDVQPYGWQAMHEEARELARCPKLEEIELINGIRSVTFLTLVRFCTSLRRVRFLDMEDVGSAEQAANVMRSMYGLRKSNLIVEFSSDFAFENWDTEEVKTVLDKVNAANRCVIKIVAVEPDVVKPNE